jgi:UDP:flavonoid glycosyltransferase YjiC (YdhE family)
MGPNIRFIGHLLPHMEKKVGVYELPEKYKHFRKKILVTQGTVEKDPNKIIEPTLEAFRNTDILVIATTGSSQTMALREKYPDANFLIEDFIPFHDVMPVCDAFITNGGYGGVMLGIANQLPMVVAGIHEGKNEVSARVGYFKLGINLKTEKPTPSQIRTAVYNIIHNPAFKTNVSRLAAEFRQFDPLALSEKYITELLAAR